MSAAPDQHADQRAAQAIAARAMALHAALLAGDSATGVLEAFFRAPVSIRRVAVAPLLLAPEQRGRLRVAGGEQVLHRRVRLMAGGRVLSEADLWYLPGRLPHDMAVALRETDEPFGHIVRPLAPLRTTIAARICAPGEAQALDHRALLTAGGRPIAEVHERYRAEVLGGA